MKKQFILILPVLAILSCNSGNEKKTANPPAKPSVAKPDSTAKPIADPSINPYAGVDVSPMDMSYFPPDYPKIKMGNVLAPPPLARVIYSRPHLQGRHVFHEVLKYGEPWRLGANEATELELFNDAIIQDKKIKAGRYILYCIPDTNTWTIAINKNIDSWGLRPDTGKDVARFVVPVTTSSSSLEYFTMIFDKASDTGAELLMAWDNVEVRLPISF